MIYTCLTVFADVVTNDAVENNKNENPAWHFFNLKDPYFSIHSKE